MEKYHKTVAFLTSAEVFDELLAGAELYARLMHDLPLVAHLLSTALKLGVSPDRAVTAMIVQDHAGPRVDVAHLMAILDDAADDLEGAALAAERLAQPTDSDMNLDDFAAELGIDIAQIRADVAARSMRPQRAR